MLSASDISTVGTFKVLQAMHTYVNILMIKCFVILYTFVFSSIVNLHYAILH